jgi:hypothetical protein
MGGGSGVGRHHVVGRGGGLAPARRGREEEGSSRRGTSTRSRDRGGTWAVPRGCGPVVLGQPESTVLFPI